MKKVLRGDVRFISQQHCIFNPPIILKTLYSNQKPLLLYIIDILYAQGQLNAYMWAGSSRIIAAKIWFLIVTFQNFFGFTLTFALSDNYKTLKLDF